MIMNRALINYVSLLEKEEIKLQEKLGILELMFDGGVSWSFMFFEPDSKENLQSLRNYIKKTNLPSLKRIKEYIRFLNTDSADAKDKLKACLENTELSKDDFLEEAERKQAYLQSHYTELIEFIEYLMK